MKYFEFKTFTTVYYFPEMTKGQEYLYGLYSAYGGILSKIYWYTFRHFKVVRAFTAKNESELPFPYLKIKEIDGTDSTMSFNMGSPGVEQKISILGYDKILKQPFFAKFSQKKVAMDLTENEIEVYKLLQGKELAPTLLMFKRQEDYIYLKAEYIKGTRPRTYELTDDVLNLCLRLKDYHLSKVHINEVGLTMSLSHGDFCPWNILVSDDGWKLIDWELAKDRPLGYDLFTYICQIAILFNTDSTLLHAIDRHMDIVRKYFALCNESDYIPYLKAFAQEKVEYEKGKNNMMAADKYMELLSSL